MKTLRRWRIVPLVGLLASCTYGPSEEYARIANHAIAPDPATVAFAVYGLRSRPPTGLSTFPDGGRPLVLAEAAAVYVCDTVTLAVKRIWRVDRPRPIRTGFTPWLGPWTPAGIYVSLRGDSTPTSDPSAFVRENYLLGPAGPIDSGVAEPPLGVATSEPAACARAVLAEAKTRPPTSP